jgi:hypothetical protein
MAPKPMDETVGPVVPSVRKFMVMLLIGGGSCLGDSMRLVIAPVKRRVDVMSQPSGVDAADA